MSKIEELTAVVAGMALRMEALQRELDEMKSVLKELRMRALRVIFYDDGEKIPFCFPLEEDENGNRWVLTLFYKDGVPHMNRYVILGHSLEKALSSTPVIPPPLVVEHYREKLERMGYKMYIASKQ